MRRLPPGSFREAAFAGLQDSAPRAALLSLHARVAEVQPDDWEDSSLAQTWAPRGAAFVVARHDLGVFAGGIVPRSPELRTPLERLGHRVTEAVAAGANTLDAVGLQVGADAPTGGLRLAAALAGHPIRWDARTTVILAREPPTIDPEDARLELARRFLRSLGPSDPARYCGWAWVTEDDAAETFRALRPELTEVDGGWLLTADLERDESTVDETVEGVRFLPFMGDPVLQPGDLTVVGRLRANVGDLPPWAAGGIVLVDGDPVASWGRRQGNVRILPLRDLGRSVRDRIEAEAVTMPIPRARVRVAWGPP